MSYKITGLIFTDVPINRARTKLNRVGISADKGSRKRSDGTLHFTIDDDDSLPREDIIELSDKLSLIVRSDIVDTNEILATQILFNISTSSAGKWMSALDIEKIGVGGGLRSGDYSGWTRYRIAEKGSGKNKKYVGLGEKIVVCFAIRRRNS